jgi:hypothetical protein
MCNIDTKDDYIKITQTKMDKVGEMLNVCKHDRNYYKVVSFKSNNEFSADILKDCRLYKFRYQNGFIFDKRSRKLDIVYEHDGMIHSIEIVKLNKYISKRVLKELRTRENKYIRKFVKTVDEQILKSKGVFGSTFIYIDVQSSVLQSYTEPIDIDLDIQFGKLNEGELKEYLHTSASDPLIDLIKFTEVETLDFENIFDSYNLDEWVSGRNYIVNITTFTGDKINLNSFNKMSKRNRINGYKEMIRECKKFLYQKYLGTKKLVLLGNDQHDHKTYRIVL